MIKFIVLMAWILLQAVVEAFIFVLLWGWFATVEPLNLPTLQPAHVMGLFVIFSLVTTPILLAIIGDKNEGKDPLDVLGESVGRNLSVWAMVLATAGVAHWWM